MVEYDRDRLMCDVDAETEQDAGCDYAVCAAPQWRL